MKHLCTIVLALIFSLSSCTTTYETTVSGISNSSSIKVVKATKTINDYNKDLKLIIGDKEYPLGKIFSDKHNMKAPIYPINNGKNKVIIKNDNDIIYEKTLFISNRETRKIILE